MTCPAELLVNGFDEEGEQGLYAYLLWPQPGGVDPSNAHDLARVIFQAKPQHYCSGTIYWMVEGCDPLDAEYHLAKRDWSFLWDHYHYQRARLILHRLGWTPSVGPMLVIGFYPLASIARPKPVLGKPELVIDMESLDQNRRRAVLEAVAEKIFNRPLKRLKHHWSLHWLGSTLGLSQEEVITAIHALQ